MTDKMDLSLDDIIKMNNSGRGGRGGRGSQNAQGWRDSGFGPIRGHRGGTRGNIRPSPYTWPMEVPEISRQHDGTRLVISNLHFKVSDSDIKELFAEFGPIKKSSVHYDRSGRSLGNADVVFVRRADALKSIERYNNRLLDGRPMKIQLATNFIPEIPERRQIDRLANGDSALRGNHSGPWRGGRFTMRGRRDRRGYQKVTTVEGLDAELDAYLNEVTKVPTVKDGLTTTTKEQDLDAYLNEVKNVPTVKNGRTTTTKEEDLDAELDAYLNEVKKDPTVKNGPTTTTEEEDLNAELDAYLNEVTKIPTVEDGPTMKSEEIVMDVVSEQTLTKCSLDDSLDSLLIDLNAEMDAYYNKVNTV